MKRFLLLEFPLYFFNNSANMPFFAYNSGKICNFLFETLTNYGKINKNVKKEVMC